MRKFMLCLLITMLFTAFSFSSATAESRTPLNVGPNVGRQAILTYDDCFYAPWTGVGTRKHTGTPEEALVNYKATIAELVRLKASVIIAPTGMCVEMFKKHLGIDIAQYARQRGQYVMSHAYSHRDLTTLSKKQIRWQIAHSEKSYWVRPPYGAANRKVNRVLKSMHRRAWNWTWSGADWMGYPQKKVVEDTVTNCRNGSTCLLHQHANGFSPEAIRQTVEGMRAKGTAVCGLRSGTTAVRWTTLSCGN